MELGRHFGRYGYRRVTTLLKEADWGVNRKRVERIWRREGLKVPQRTRVPAQPGYAEPAARRLGVGKSEVVCLL